MKKSATISTGTRWLAWCLGWFLGIGAIASAQPPGEPVNEYQVKAVYLYNFSRFTNWPKQAFEADRKHFNVCILGEDPFQVELDVAVEGEQGKGRPIRVLRLDSEAEADSCQILFVGHLRDKNQAEILSRLAAKPILTVSEKQGFIHQAGGMVEFYKQGSKIRFYIAQGKVKQAGLRISGNLLRIATVVDKE